MAALIGMAMFALIKDIAARSGRGSPVTFSSSSLVSRWYCSFFATLFTSLRRLLIGGPVLWVPGSARILGTAGPLNDPATAADPGAGSLSRFARIDGDDG